MQLHRAAAAERERETVKDKEKKCERGKLRPSQREQSTETLSGSLSL